MKAKFLVAALSAIALTACNNDEVLEVNRGRGISFQVATESPARATATTSNTISEFMVWGFTDGKTLMNGIKVTKTEEDTWEYTNTVFWPETDVNFYSVSPTENIGGTVSISNNEQKITSFTVNTEQSKQVDLLYAVNTNEKKANHETSAVDINFRHALSQIVFRAKNTNAHLKVVINGVKVANIIKGGDFTYPSQATTDQNTDVNGTIVPGTQGTWKLLSGTENIETYTAGTKTNVILDGASSDAVDLTTTDAENSSVYTGALFLMPQELTPWNVKDDKSNDANGSYFLVNCKIYNKADNSNDEVQLWPKTAGEFDYVAIPTSDIEWEQGKKYVYTFIFGEGGGYVPPTDPDPDEPGEPEPGDPVLVPIDFEVTVDVFINGQDQDIDMVVNDEE